MAQRQGFKNIQIQSKQDFYELFEDTFEQSGANSKAEFLKMLIDIYLNPEEPNTKDLRNLEERLSLADEEKEKLSVRLGLYETEGLKAILNKHKGEKLIFRNSMNQKMTIEINDLPDVFSAIFNSVKIN
jgi:hypothetical protein